MHRFDTLRTASPASTTTSTRTTNPSSSSLSKASTPFSTLFVADIPLQNAWNIWSISKPKQPNHPQNSNNPSPQQAASNSYEQAVTPVARFDTVNTFCAIYSRLSRPGTPHPIPVLTMIYILIPSYHHLLYV